jgi:hypothetical protein
MRYLLLLAALLCFALPARAQIIVPDAFSAATTLGALNANVMLAVAGRQGASVQFTGGPVNGTLTAWASRDGGSSWASAPFIDSNGYVYTSLTGSAISAFSLGIPLPVGTTHVKVQMTAWTSGSFTATLRATFNGGFVSAQASKRGFAPVTTAISCTTGATPMQAATPVNRTSLCVQNQSGVVVYIGSAGVSTANGIQLNNGDSFCDDVGQTPYYCLVASGSATVRIMEN